MNPPLVWNLVLTDAGLFLSYIFIAWGLVRYASEEIRPPFRDITMLFALFIGMDAIGHALQAWVSYVPAFWAEVVVQWLTLALAVAAASLWFIKYRERVEYDLATEALRVDFRTKQDELERRVAELEKER